MSIPEFIDTHEVVLSGGEVSKLMKVYNTVSLNQIKWEAVLEEMAVGMIGLSDSHRKKDYMSAKAFKPDKSYDLLILC
jgi:hypothetical protein